LHSRGMNIPGPPNNQSGQFEREWEQKVRKAAFVCIVAIRIFELCKKRCPELMKEGDFFMSREEFIKMLFREKFSESKTFDALTLWETPKWELDDQKVHAQGRLQAFQTQLDQLKALSKKLGNLELPPATKDFAKKVQRILTSCTLWRTRNEMHANDQDAKTALLDEWKDTIGKEINELFEQQSQDQTTLFKMIKSVQQSVEKTAPTFPKEIFSENIPRSLFNDAMKTDIEGSELKDFFKDCQDAYTMWLTVDKSLTDKVLDPDFIKQKIREHTEELNKVQRKLDIKMRQRDDYPDIITLFQTADEKTLKKWAQEFVDAETRQQPSDEPLSKKRRTMPHRECKDKMLHDPIDILKKQIRQDILSNLVGFHGYETILQLREKLECNDNGHDMCSGKGYTPDGRLKRKDQGALSHIREKEHIKAAATMNKISERMRQVFENATEPKPSNSEGSMSDDDESESVSECSWAANHSEPPSGSEESFGREPSSE